MGLQDWILEKIAPTKPVRTRQEELAYQDNQKLRTLLGHDFLESVRGKTVIDFACGQGNEAIEMIRSGAERVIGIDTWPSELVKAREKAKVAGVLDRCSFVSATEEKASLIVCIDAFEHFADPDAILESMSRLLHSDGSVLISFGPPWFHPLGGHLFSFFPWSHLLFSEKALIKWRSKIPDIGNDGATRFSEVTGGLNQMTLRKFRRLVERSPFKIEYFEAVPIRRVAIFHNSLTKELLTSVVRVKLKKKTA